MIYDIAGVQTYPEALESASYNGLGENPMFEGYNQTLLTVDVELSNEKVVTFEPHLNNNYRPAYNKMFINDDDADSLEEVEVEAITKQFNTKFKVQLGQTDDLINYDDKLTEAELKKILSIIWVVEVQ